MLDQITHTQYKRALSCVHQMVPRLDVPHLCRDETTIKKSLAFELANVRPPFYNLTYDVRKTQNMQVSGADQKRAEMWSSDLTEERLRAG